MNNSDISVVCRACERKVKMEQIKYDDVRNAYVCDICFNATHKEKPIIKDPFVNETVKSISSLKEGLIKYNCTKCNYHFARQKGKTISKCPYCGSNNLETLSTSANSLLSD